MFVCSYKHCQVENVPPKKPWKFRRVGGVHDYGILRAWGVMHSGISEGKGGLKHESRLWLGMDIFWNCPMYVNSETRKYFQGV